ncbi:MAG: hypothetical protein COW01_13610 [Bdellovibrionales bacterium CG12_big_fil_rev_8_21_14_0_65_38_15]|nr:MAG: hypothetical protein COW79_16430 [Bdellovibrionales bacterium CG22_combo_CG10-13_8_21_14_all_38_13]PIQ53310.1 MAG: hypothetical protein COW01_13610 [Bdellovibrionales bacterium CG12_big_fil_rev_8_21_14_0_65_38_15]PIR30328.1 MAG: hypothetical protein COV38_06150 [Bdellovibrionales bacterium CG11_big_fil_rev_8_21_14_0_20_38_13]
MIYHLIEKNIWKKVENEYRPESLDNEGFIHFSTEDQVDGTYQRFYINKDMYLLVIDESKLKAELKYEEADGMSFPHLYGPLNLDAVKEVQDYKYNG